MRTDEIQSNLASIIRGLSFWGNLATDDLLLIDDGDIEKRKEAALTSAGICVVIYSPVGSVSAQSRTKVTMDYSTTVKVCTNPKNKVGNNPKWNPMLIEGQIIPAVIKWIPETNPGQIPFRVNESFSTEVDSFDTGTNSRMIDFVTQIIF
jgi:hypothetical protein